MKTLILSTVTALTLGAAAVAPATAQVTIQGPGYSDRDRGDCRMVEKRVVKDNKTVITKERRCDGDRRVSRDRDGDRYVERRERAPGVYIGR